MLQLTNTVVMMGDSHNDQNSHGYAMSEAVQCGLSSLHVGDVCDIDYSHMDPFIDHPIKQLALTGNHENFRLALKHPLMLYGYGTIMMGGVKAFYLAGGLSLNRSKLLQACINAPVPKDTARMGKWYPEEELPVYHLNMAIDAYIKAKPDILVSHEAPQQGVDLLDLVAESKISLLFNPVSLTSQALTAMVELHKPALSVFGHWHRSRHDKDSSGTEYRCLAINERWTLDASVYQRT